MEKKRPIRQVQGRTWGDLYGPYVVVHEGLISDYKTLGTAILVAENIAGDNVVVGRRARIRPPTETEK